MIEKELIDFVIWVGGCEIVLAVFFFWFGAMIFKKNDDVDGKQNEIDYLNFKITELQKATKNLIDEMDKKEYK